MDGTPVAQRTLIIEAVEVDKKNAAKTKHIAKTQFLMKDALRKAQGSKGKISLFLLDEKAKYKGKLEVRSCSARRYFTFFDLIFRNKLNIVPIVGVDFSLANLTFNEAQYCIHTLKPGAPNDYVDSLRCFSNAYNSYSRFSLPYGFGARTHVRSEGQDACDLFSMSGDYQDPFVGDSAELIACYQGTIKSVRLALPVNYHKVIRFVCDLAQMEFGTACDVTDIKNYYVLVLLMAGVIDDLEQSLNEILRARDIPISVVIVKIGNAEETDQKVLLSKASQVFTKCERTFIDLLEFEKFKVPMSSCIEEDLFTFELLKNLPA